MTRALVAMAMLVLTTVPVHADATKELWAALKGANDPAATTAIAKGVDVNNLDPSYATPLHFAACFSGPEVVKALIAAKANVNLAAHGNKYTPLMNALHWGNVDAVKVLMAAGADPKAGCPYGNTLTTALVGMRAELVKLVLDAGMSPASVVKSFPMELPTFSLFVTQSMTPKAKLARLLFEKDYLAKLGVTFPARLLAAQETDFAPLDELTKLLIDKGLDVNVKIPSSGSYVFLAANLGKTDIVSELVKSKANLETRGFISAKESAGFISGQTMTPLMIASMRGHNAIVELLCKGGASVNATTQQFRVESSAGHMTTTQTTITITHTAVSLASANKHPGTVAILQKYGGHGFSGQ